MKDLEDIVKKVSKVKKPKKEAGSYTPKTSREWLEEAYPPERSRASKVGGIGYV
tara:strand:- start:443 stop:604 length:162 start_codon:yes stop_codon:yes gene_type:complete